MKGKLFYVFVILIIVYGTKAQNILDNRHAVLDGEGNYVVDWAIDHINKMVTFTVTAKTLGYIGFGISTKAMMSGADIVIGGVNADGKPYFTDRHGEGNFEPVIDSEQVWELLEASENSSHTTLKFIRGFDTCKDGDLPFTTGTTNFIWALGENDNIQRHKERGSQTINILDPEFPDIDTSNLKSYEVTHTMVMPKQHTSYWCTIHRSPLFDKKNHVVAFRTNLSSPEAIKHAHHYGIYKCSPPNGVDAAEFFEPFVGKVGGECYDSDQEVVPSNYCRSLFYVWAVGGKMLSLPSNVGYPIGQDGQDSREYYMYEIHYDNPDEQDGIAFETATTVYYTEQLREVEAGIWVVGKFLENMVAITIPPKSIDLTLASHCSPKCLENQLPTNGIKIINVLLHAHLAGRKIKMRHFRDNKELPWGANDESYDFNYQQSRPLREELVVLPNDHLTVECTYDSTFRNGTTVGGQSTREEMCESIMWYYPKIELMSCYSEYSIENWFNKFGIEEAEWNNNYNLEPVIRSPLKYNNMTYTQILDNIIDWTEDLREEIKWDARYATHKGACVYENGTKFETPIGYPHVKQTYSQNQTCPKDTVGSNEGFRNKGGIVLVIMIGILTTLNKT